MNGRLPDVRELARVATFMRDRVLATLRDGPKTVPEIAQALGHPTNAVMFWVMSARKYGYIEELAEATDEGYYKYRLVEKGDHDDEGSYGEGKP